MFVIISRNNKNYNNKYSQPIFTMLQFNYELRIRIHKFLKPRILDNAMHFNFSLLCKGFLEF